MMRPLALCLHGASACWKLLLTFQSRHPQHMTVVFVLVHPGGCSRLWL